MISRRKFLQSSLAGSAAAAAAPLLFSTEAYAQAAGAPFTLTDGAGAALLNPAAQPKFVSAVPNAAWPAFSFTPPAAGGGYTIGVTEIPAHVTGLVDAAGAPLTTKVWGYASYDAAGNMVDTATYPGRTVFARSGTPISVTWVNELRQSGLPVPHVVPVDTTLNIAQPGPGPVGYDAYGIPIVQHQHGGNTPFTHDGGPDQWFTPTLQSNSDSPAFGPGCISTGTPRTCNMPSVYPMAQEGGAALWYHDHALGITRLNVYAGPAGFWLTRDANEDALIAGNVIPRNVNSLDNYEVALAIQDRMFNADGSLYYPSDPALYPLPGLALPTPAHMPEFFGDTMLVNGIAWPKLSVEPRPIRLRLLNGSDSRFYNLRLVPEAIVNATISLAAFAARFPRLANTINALITRTLQAASIPFWQIGTELGMLNRPVQLRNVTFGNGERLDLVVDFSAFNGAKLVMINDAPTPAGPGGAPTPIDSGAAQVMRFDVSVPLNAAVPKPPALRTTTNLRPVHGALPTLASLTSRAVTTRKLILAEGADHFGRIMPLLGTVADGTVLLDEPITEKPKENTVEIWEFYNLTVDVHPLHMHLVDFRILDRQAFTSDPLTLKQHQMGPNVIDGLGPITGITLSGAPQAVPANEDGRKDTAQCPPGFVTRLLVSFPSLPRDANNVAIPSKFVYHCHILSHEDSEMMRFYEVQPA